MHNYPERNFLGRIVGEIDVWIRVHEFAGVVLSRLYTSIARRLGRPSVLTRLGCKCIPWRYMFAMHVGVVCSYCEIGTHALGASLNVTAQHHNEQLDLRKSAIIRSVAIKPRTTQHPNLLACKSVSTPGGLSS